LSSAIVCDVCTPNLIFFNICFSAFNSYSIALSIRRKKWPCTKEKLACKLFIQDLLTKSPNIYCYCLKIGIEKKKKRNKLLPHLFLYKRKLISFHYIIKCEYKVVLNQKHGDETKKGPLSL
jgi:hypothetical protein